METILAKVLEKIATLFGERLYKAVLDEKERKKRAILRLLAESKRVAANLAVMEQELEAMASKQHSGRRYPPRGHLDYLVSNIYDSLIRIESTLESLGPAFALFGKETESLFRDFVGEEGIYLHDSDLRRQIDRLRAKQRKEALEPIVKQLDRARASLDKFVLAEYKWRDFSA